MKLLKEDIQTMLTNYDIGELINYTLLLEGTVQFNLKLNTTNGTFILKYYINRNYEEVLFEYSLIHYLVENNFPTASIVSSENKSLQKHKGHPYIIFKYIEGEHIINPSKKHIQQVIKKMGLLHELTESVEFKHVKNRLTYTPHEISTLVKEKVNTINTENAKKKYSWWLKEFEKLILPDEMRRSICHTDYNPLNIFFIKDEFEALIDFDDANYTYRCYDVVSFINFFEPSFNHNNWKDFEKEDILNLTDAKDYIRLYDKLFGINEVDKVHLYDLLKFITLIDCLWYFERGEYYDFYERRKIESLNLLGREAFYSKLFKE
ncbi:phosphotransferase [Alkalibacterium putridalgicola]|uniref:phosphotransferase n=1 Tax=Alkalibacterium putridalgicola TaxID=426703 RepID=UPI0034CF8E40